MIAHLGTGAFLAKARNVVLLGPGVSDGSDKVWQRLPLAPTMSIRP
jgi:hypothetical protein